VWIVHNTHNLTLTTFPLKYNLNDIINYYISGVVGKKVGRGTRLQFSEGHYKFAKQSKQLQISNKADFGCSESYFGPNLKKNKF